jgi:hypothetical protein
MPSGLATVDAVPGPPRPGLRLVFALAIGILTAVYVVAYGRANPDVVSDFDQVWAGARALWNGKNPYDVVGPHGEFHWRWPLYYPLPALVLVAPLGLLPVLAARAIFSSVSALLLAWAVTRDGWFRLPLFISVSFFVTIELVQWSALYTAAFFVPALGFAAIAKPNMGVALGGSAWRNRTLWWMLGGAACLLVLSYLVLPGWHEPWLRNLREAPHFRAAVTRPLGFLLLLALLRWRRPEARWLLGLSVVPMAPTFYDQLMLAAVCLTSRETLIYAASTVVLWFYVALHNTQPDYASWGALVGNATVWICYFPVLVMVLRRPNEGVLPEVVSAAGRRLERLFRRA